MVQVTAQADVAQEICEPTEPEPYIEVSPASCSVPLAGELKQYAEEVCREYDVPPELAYAVMQVESGYTVDAVSKTGDYGLMQINSINAKWLENELEVTDLMDARQNITAGCYMLGMYLDKYDGDTNRALMAYNLGAGGAERAWKQGVRYTDYTNKVWAAMLNLLEEERDVN